MGTSKKPVASNKARKIPLRLNQQEGLRQIIFEQAGTLLKALMEAVMNGVDQEAKNIIVTITHDYVRVEDDGKGFPSVKVIEDLFAEFAAPHVAGDAAFGRYRVGRGQLFAKGVNTYTSNGFLVMCNAKKELALHLYECDPPHNGCVVHIDLYEPEQTPGRLAVELADACRYVNAKLVINDTIVVGLNEVNDTWDEKVFKGFRSRLRGDVKTLKVYNQGVLIAEHGESWLACRGMAGGVVTSEPGEAFELNTARNEVQDSCKLWTLVKKLSRDVYTAYSRDRQNTIESEAATIAAVYRSIGVVVGTAIKGLDAATIVRSIYQQLRSSCAHDRIGDTAWVPSTSGELRSPKYLHRFGLLAHGVSGNSEADRLMQRREAFVVNIELLLRQCGLSYAYADTVMRVIASLSNLRMVDLGELSTRSKYRLLTKAETMATAVTRVWYDVLSCLMHDEGACVSAAAHPGERSNWAFSRSRVFAFGECDSPGVMGWTDGSTYIAVPTTMLPKTTTPSLSVRISILDKFAGILRHEWCHTDRSDMPNHIHSPAFYELFHNASTLMSPYRRNSVAMAQQRLERGFVLDKRRRERAADKRAFVAAQKIRR